MEEINIYDNKFNMLRNIDKKPYIKFIVFLIIFFIVFLILVLIKYPNIYKFDGFATGDKVVLSILNKDLDKLKGNILKINNKTYNYSILSYEYLNKESGYSNELLVTLIINNKIKNNQVVSVLIEDGETNLYKSFIKKLWKGF